MKWFKIGAVLLVVVFFVLYLGVNLVDSRSSVLPAALIARLRELGFALYGYSQEHGRFPDRLEDLVESPIYLGEAVDPYSSDRSLFGYRRVIDATGEHYELYTVRMTAPAQIGWLTAEKDLWARTPAFEALRKNELVPESRNEKLRPGADFSERLLFLFQKGR
jgi:hypothetical protein